jgi:hypothetical protein
MDLDQSSKALLYCSEKGEEIAGLLFFDEFLFFL